MNDTEEALDEILEDTTDYGDTAYQYDGAVNPGYCEEPADGMQEDDLQVKFPVLLFQLFLAHIHKDPLTKIS